MKKRRWVKSPVLPKRKKGFWWRSEDRTEKRKRVQKQTVNKKRKMGWQ
jgi:hypothetical protein